MTNWQNRITGQGVQKASEFLANPENWRVHPQFQREAVKGSLDTLGWIQQVIVNTTTGHLIDGHERVWQALDNDDADVPYIEVTLTDDEERQALATLDPLSALAQTDFNKLRELTNGLVINNKALTQMLDKLKGNQTDRMPGASNVPFESKYAVLIYCADETDQTKLLNRFLAEGLSCRALLS